MVRLNMSIFSRLFGKKTKKVEEKSTVESSLDDFEEAFKNKPELADALKNTMFLDPRKIDITLKDAVSKAREMERKGDKLRAAIWYRIAGGLAIYKGDVSKVKEYFGKYSKLTGKSLKILEIPEECVKGAQKYYAKYLEKSD